MGLSDFMAQTEAQSNIVTFGRDLQTVTPTTLEITENGEYDVRYYAKVDVNVEGNPNYKEVLTGKANELEISEETAQELLNGDANAEIVIDTSPLQMGITSIEGPLLCVNSIAYTMMFADLKETVAECNCYQIGWAISDGTAYAARGLMGGNILDMTAYLSLLDYTLTIYHHKMPEEA